MNCPQCASALTKEQTKKTALGYRTFRCSDCKHAFNERTGTPFNFLEYPTDIVLLVVRLPTSLQVELAGSRGDGATPAVGSLPMRQFATGKLVSHRSSRINSAKSDVDKQAPAGMSMRTYVKVHGKWCSLYRAIDRDGNLVAEMLSQKRNMEAAKRFAQTNA